MPDFFDGANGGCRMYKVARVLSVGMALAVAVTDAAFADAFPDAISVPEPSSMSLLAMGAIGVLIGRKFKRRK